LSGRIHRKEVSTSEHLTDRPFLNATFTINRKPDPTMKHLFALASCSLICCSNSFGQAIIDRYLTDALTYTDIVISSDQVDNPRDLDFKPHTNELWVMLRGGNNGGSFVIVHNAGLPGQTDEYRKDSHSGHFMTQASAMAFSPNGEFAAVNEIQNTAGPTSTFMGPALWDADLNIFATVFQSDWEAGRPLGSHIDMLHQSPFAMGIAADSAKVYWVMDGHNGNICRYDFVQDHGPGYDYHGAGKIWRYIDVEVERVANIPSHMVLDRTNGWLYFIDGGNKQIKRMNVWSGEETGRGHRYVDHAALRHGLRGRPFDRERPHERRYQSVRRERHTHCDRHDHHGARRHHGREDRTRRQDLVREQHAGESGAHRSIAARR
jgi:hypothetical protein